MLPRPLAKALYSALLALTRITGGVRPRRIYDWLAQRAFDHDHPDFVTFRNRWGHELSLSHAYHIDRNILIWGTYDLELHLALERLIRPGMIVFDVGANLGEMALHMAQLVGNTGQVWAFEPVPQIHRRLVDHVHRNGMEKVVRAALIALSDRTGRATLAAPDQGIDNQGLGSLANVSNKSGPLRLDVATMTLDDFVARHQISRIDLIKVDIQGAEPLFLRGGQKTLREFGPDLLMEFSPEDLRPAGVSSRDLARSLAELGYDIHALTPGGFGPAIAIETISNDFAATNILARKGGRATDHAAGR